MHSAHAHWVGWMHMHVYTGCGRGRQPLCTIPVRSRAWHWTSSSMAACRRHGALSRIPCPHSGSTSEGASAAGRTPSAAAAALCGAPGSDDASEEMAPEEEEADDEEASLGGAPLPPLAGPTARPPSVPKRRSPPRYSRDAADVGHSCGGSPPTSLASNRNRIA